MPRESEEQKRTRRLIDFLGQELDEHGEGLLVMIARERTPTEVVLQDPRKDVAFETGMTGPQADATLLRAVEANLIGASFGLGGPNADTATVWVTHISTRGLEMSGDWEEATQQPSQQFIFNAAAYGIFGSQQHFAFEQVIGDLDRQIEEKGGEDKEELREMVEEIRQTLESQDSITRSKFERWSELANKHAPWLLGPLGNLLINYVF